MTRSLAGKAALVTGAAKGIGAVDTVRRCATRVVRRRLPRVGERSEPTQPKLARSASEGWLGRRDSNPNNRVQSAVSYR